MTERTTLVTGSSSGLGEAIVLKLLQDSHHVIGVSRGEASGDILQNENFTQVFLDFSDLNRMEKEISYLAQRYSKVSSVVFCAGYGKFGNIEEFSFRQLRHLIDTNLTAQLLLARAFTPLMKRQKSGNLIFIGSESSLSGGRRGVGYVAAKSGLLGLARALRQECSGSGVRVGIINLGMTKTAFYDESKFTHGDSVENYIEPGDVAEAVSMMIHMRAGTVVDEITMTPLKSVIKRRKKTEN